MKPKLALVIITVVLVASLAANAYLYKRQYRLATDNALQKEVDDLNGQVANLQEEKTNIQNQLLSRLNQTQVPRLVTRLGTKDVRSSPYLNHPWSGQIRFYISGEVWNVGRISANNSKLHVTLYQGSVIANDTFIGLGTIAAGSYVDVNANVPYQGEPLTKWTVTTEYTY